MTEQRLLRPDLWDLIRPAITAAREAGREYAEKNRYLPRRSERSYYENAAGWPFTTKSELGGGPATGPINWPEILGFHEGLFTRIVVADVPVLADAVSRIGRNALADEELMRGVSMLAPYRDSDEKKREQVEFEVVRHLIGEILNRADAIGAEDDEQLRQVYAEIEQARFAAELTGDVIIPLVAISFTATTPFQVEEDTWIEKLTEADHRNRALDWIRHDNVSPYVAAAATHAVVIRKFRFRNQVHSLDSNGDLPPELSTETAHRVAEAIHIVTDMSTGFAQVLVRPHGWADSWVHDLPPLWSAWTGRAYPEDLNNREWVNEMKPINADRAGDVVRVARGLRTAPKNIKIAARRYRRTTYRDDIEDVVLDVAIGIEALVGKEPDALTHRMAQRAAVALAEELPPENTYNLLKQFYGIRSKIAHGNAPKRWTVKLRDEEWSATAVGKFLLRALLRNRLLADDPWDATSLDERMLVKLERVEGYPNVAES